MNGWMVKSDQWIAYSAQKQKIFLIVLTTNYKQRKTFLRQS
jgi:hypothetical protein